MGEHCKPNPNTYHIYRVTECSGDWHERVTFNPIEADNADQALDKFINSFQCGQPVCGEYIVLSIKTNMLLRLHVRPNRAYVIERI